MALGAPIWGLFYNAEEKSYDAGFMLAPFALAAVVAIGVLGMTRGRAQHLKLYEKELADYDRERGVAAASPG